MPERARRDAASGARAAGLRTWVALLRGINVGGRSTVPMAELRALCQALGWRAVQTWIQSGNVVFRSGGKVSELERQLEAALPDAVGVSAAVLVRSAEEWRQHVQANPFPAEASAAPNLVMLALSKLPPAAGAVEQLRARASSERIERAGAALWIHFPDGAGRSRLTPALLDRAAGSPVTMRNWRTVMKLNEMAVDMHPPDRENA